MLCIIDTLNNLYFKSKHLVSKRRDRNEHGYRQECLFIRKPFFIVYVAK